MTSIDNVEVLTNESWFIPLDIIGIILTSIIILISIIYLIAIVLDQRCHTLPMLLIANSCAVEFLLGINIINMNVFTLKNDLQRIVSVDALCFIRGYLSYSLCGLENYSYLLQALYRYTLIIYPNRLFWQKRRTQMLFICLTWIFALIFPLAFLFRGEIVFNTANQICQVPLRLSFSMIYLACFVYMIPIILIGSIYYKLVRYVHGMNRRVTLVNTLLRAKNELKMVRRTAILAGIIFTIEFPYALFVFLSFFTTPPKYHFRIAWIFIDISLVAVLIALFQFTEPLQISIRKLFKTRPNTIVPALA